MGCGASTQLSVSEPTATSTRPNRIDTTRVTAISSSKQNGIRIEGTSRSLQPQRRKLEEEGRQCDLDTPSSNEFLWHGLPVELAEDVATPLSFTKADHESIGGFICRFCNGKSCKHEDWTLQVGYPDACAIRGLNSNWITTKILAMQRPSTYLIEKYSIIDQFLRAGIRAVFNLQQPGEHAHCGYGIHKDADGFSYHPEQLQSRGIATYNLCWVDMGVPTMEFMLTIVQLMDYHLTTRGESIAVHCHAGYGRTGLAIAAWLMYARGGRVETVVKAVRSRRSACIQTKRQVKFLHEFEGFLQKLRKVFHEDTTTILNLRSMLGYVRLRSTDRSSDQNLKSNAEPVSTPTGSLPRHTPLRLLKTAHVHDILPKQPSPELPQTSRLISTPLVNSRRPLKDDTSKEKVKMSDFSNLSKGPKSPRRASLNSLNLNALILNEGNRDEKVASLLSGENRAKDAKRNQSAAPGEKLEMSDTSKSGGHTLDGSSAVSSLFLDVLEEEASDLDSDVIQNRSYDKRVSDGQTRDHQSVVKNNSFYPSSRRSLVSMTPTLLDSSRIQMRRKSLMVEKASLTPTMASQTKHFPSSLSDENHSPTSKLVSDTFGLSDYPTEVSPGNPSKVGEKEPNSDPNPYLTRLLRKQSRLLHGQEAIELQYTHKVMAALVDCLYACLNPHVIPFARLGRFIPNDGSGVFSTAFVPQRHERRESYHSLSPFLNSQRGTSNVLTSIMSRRHFRRAGNNDELKQDEECEEAVVVDLSTSPPGAEIAVAKWISELSSGVSTIFPNNSNNWNGKIQSEGHFEAMGGEEALEEKQRLTMRQRGLSDEQDDTPISFGYSPKKMPIALSPTIQHRERLVPYNVMNERSASVDLRLGSVNPRNRSRSRSQFRSRQKVKSQTQEQSSIGVDEINALPLLHLNDTLHCTTTAQNITECAPSPLSSTSSSLASENARHTNWHNETGGVKGRTRLNSDIERSAPFRKIPSLPASYEKKKTNKIQPMKQRSTKKKLSDVPKKDEEKSQLVIAAPVAASESKIVPRASQSEKGDSMNPWKTPHVKRWSLMAEAYVAFLKESLNMGEFGVLRNCLSHETELAKLSDEQDMKEQPQSISGFAYIMTVLLDFLDALPSPLIQIGQLSLSPETNRNNTSASSGDVFDRASELMKWFEDTTAIKEETVYPWWRPAIMLGSPFSRTTMQFEDSPDEWLIEHAGLIDVVDLVDDYPHIWGALSQIARVVSLVCYPLGRENIFTRDASREENNEEKKDISEIQAPNADDNNFAVSTSGHISSAKIRERLNDPQVKEWTNEIVMNLLFSVECQQETCSPNYSYSRASRSRLCFLLRLGYSLFRLSILHPASPISAENIYVTSLESYLNNSKLSKTEYSKEGASPTMVYSDVDDGQASDNTGVRTYNIRRGSSNLCESTVFALERATSASATNILRSEQADGTAGTLSRDSLSTITGTNWLARRQSIPHIISSVIPCAKEQIVAAWVIYWIVQLGVAIAPHGEISL